MLRHLAAGGEIADLIWEVPDELVAEHGQVFQAAIRAYHAADSERADELWENVRAIWSQAWSANYAVLEFFQNTGLTRFSPVKPQHWVVASFEHHTSPRGLPRPHIRNIVFTASPQSVAPISFPSQPWLPFAPSTGETAAAERFFDESRGRYRGVSPFPLALLEFRRGLMWITQGDLHRARMWLGAAHRRLPGYAPAQGHLAEVEAALGETDSAITRLRPLTISSDDPDYAAQLARILNDVGRVGGP